MQYGAPMLRDKRLLVIGIIIVLVALGGAFINPLLFLLGLSVLIVAFIPEN